MEGNSRRLGRPPGTGIPPEQRRKPRSVRMTDEQWANFQALGTAWLDMAIDEATAAKSGQPDKSAD
jgi:hypothetical protein